MKAAKSDVKIGDVVVLKICASTSAVAASEIARKSSNVRYVFRYIFGSRISTWQIGYLSSITSLTVLTVHI